MMQNLNREERITFVDDRAEVLPGISVSLFGGHTPGQTLTEVTSTAGQIVLASDAAHLYEEFETDRAFNMFHNLEDMYGAYERLRAFDDRPDTTVIPGHDPRVGMRFDQVEADCFDLTNKVTDN
jgi:glyoxylase-like metal-dependent hydrolase (beta-lactamase superfamily II)